VAAGLRARAGRRSIDLLYDASIESTANPTDLAALAHDLDRRIARVSQLLRSSNRTGRSVTALLTLRRLDLEGPSRITELAAREYVAQPTMTVLVRRLEQDGLVERTADSEDGRASRIALTATGREELNAVRADRADVLRRRLELLDPESRAALAAALPVLDDLLAADPDLTA
jgi:DNA-binding MarR family transcriptional regulator